MHKRQAAWLIGLLVGLTVSGCGGSGGGVSLAQRLRGTWELRQRSTDGGNTFTTITNGFRFTLNRDGTWTDTDGASGTWQLDGDRFTTFEPGQPTLYALIELSDGDKQLRFSYTDANWRLNRRVSIYRRMNN